jgi:hypothetical protein
LNPAPYSAAKVVENSRKLAEAFRAHGSPVVYVRVDLNDFMQLAVDQSLNLGDTPLPAVASEIAPSAGFQPGDILLTKRHWGAFAGTDLELQLKTRGIDTVVLAGISTNMGVESTARQGTGLGLHSWLSRMPAPHRMRNNTASHSKRSSRVSHESALPTRFVPPLPESSNETDRLDPLILKITTVAVLGSFLSQLDATVVNVSLSSLAVELHSSLTAIQWVTSGYLLALALMLPLNGWLVERIGAKSLYLWCFSVFTLSSALCGLAWSANSLVAFRVLQGMSGGLMAPMAQMMMARAAGRHMARVLGYAAVPIMLGPILGPVIAGAILQHASWPGSSW